MAIRHIWKASLLTAVLLLAPLAIADETSNPEDGSHSEENGNATPPCTPILVGTSEPYVNIIWHCLGSWP